MGKEKIEFFKKSRELIDHAHCMEMATNYKPKTFNYGYYGTLLRKVLNEVLTDDEIKEIYSNKG